MHQINLKQPHSQVNFLLIWFILIKNYQLLHVSCPPYDGWPAAAPPQCCYTVLSYNIVPPVRVVFNLGLRSFSIPKLERILLTTWPVTPNRHLIMAPHNTIPWYAGKNFLLDLVLRHVCTQIRSYQWFILLWEKERRLYYFINYCNTYYTYCMIYI